MAEMHESFFYELEQQFNVDSKGVKPIPLADFSPIHGLLQYAHDLQGDIRSLDFSRIGSQRELGVAGAYMLDERLRTLNPQELSLSFVAIKSFAILDVISESNFKLFDFDGIHLINGTPKEFIYDRIYNRPTLSLTFENAEFLSDVPLAEENPSVPSDFLAVPVYSLRLDRED